MWHTIWILMPVWGCNVRAHNPDSSQPNTPVHEDWRPSLNVNVQIHPIIEQDVQVMSAALLKGEEKRILSVSSEQAAALGTPLTFDTPLLPLTTTPTNLEATSQPHTYTYTHIQTLMYCTQISDWESGTPWHLPPLASHPACTSLGPSQKTQRKQGE